MHPGRRTVLLASLALLPFLSSLAPIRPSSRLLAQIQADGPDSGLDRGLVRTRDGAAPRLAADFGLPDVGLFLRAGRSVPPGLTATRARERERERSAALELLATEVAEGSASREAWLSAIETILSSRAARAGLWSVAAGAVGELGLHRFDEQLARGLDPEASTFVRFAASQALARLYGEHPDPDSGFERPFELDASSARLLELLREREAASLALRAQLFEADPARALDSLSDDNPAVRRLAAECVGLAVGSGHLDSEPARVALQDALAAEASAHAFHAELQSLLQLTAGSPPDAPAVANLRGYLLRRASEAPNSFLLTLAVGLARLPWSEGPERPETNLRAAQQHLANLLRRVAADPYGDADVTSGVLGALEDLLSHVASVTASGLKEDGHWVRGAAAREPLLALLTNPRVAEGVRRRAATTLARVALTADVPVLLDVLDDEGTSSGLKYDLLGTLAAMSAELDGEARAVVGRLLAFLEHPEADLRRRALGFLRSPELRAHLESDDLELVVERLRSEPVAELRSGLLALLTERGGEGLLEPLLAHESFDQLVVGAPTGMAELAQVLEELSAGNPQLLMRSARRLAEVDDEGTRLPRLLRCLQLASGLDEDEAQALSAADHGRVVAWARAVRGAGVLVHDALRDGRDFLDRLLALHMPQSAGARSMSEAERAHTRALFLSDVVMLGEPEREEETFEEFARALQSAEQASETFFAARVRRDRARFALSREYPTTALVDLGVLVSKPELASVLELSDLRTLAHLIVSVDPAVEPVDAELEAYEVLLGLVTRPAWRNELGAVRLVDLATLAERAIGTGDPANVRRVHELLADLPPATGGGGTNGRGTDDLPIWDGLDREPALLDELRGVVGRLEALLVSSPPIAGAGEGEGGGSAPRR